MLEEKKVCFLDIAQACDTIWHEGVNHKLKLIVVAQRSEILQSYIAERAKNKYSDLRSIQAGISQGNTLVAILFLLYIGDLLKFKQNIVAIFTNDKILAIDDNNQINKKVTNSYRQNTKRD